MEARMPDAEDMPYPQYHCPVCGTELPLSEARLSITCAEHKPDEEPLKFDVRPAVGGDTREIEKLCDRAWGETDIDTFGTSFDVLSCENIVAEAEGRLAGLISLAVHGGELAIVLLSVYPEMQGHGVGRALVDEAAGLAKAKGLPFLKVAVTNDDIASLYFYQRLCFVICDIAIGAEADKLGSVAKGFADIPVRDEVRLRRPIA